MKKKLISCLLWPVDLCAINAAAKISGLNQSDVLRTLCRLGLESVKYIPGTELKKLAYEMEATYAAKQFVINEDGTSPYVLRHKAVYY
jgi:hypothetical protein